MLKTRFYVCPNLSSCVRTCAAGHSWDDRHAHLQELRGEAPPWWRKRPEERPHAGGWGARQLPQQWKFLEDSRKVLWFTIHRFLECHFTPCSLWNMEQFLKKCVSLRVRESVIPVWPNRSSGILVLPKNKKKYIVQSGELVNTCFYHSFVSLKAFMWNNLSDTIWHTWNNPHKFH